MPYYLVLRCEPDCVLKFNQAKNLFQHCGLDSQQMQPNVLYRLSRRYQGCCPMAIVFTTPKRETVCLVERNRDDHWGTHVEVEFGQLRELDWIQSPKVLAIE